MARVLVAVDDPLSLATDAPVLLLDSFVSVAIDVGELTDHIVIPRDMLRQDDHVWQVVDGQLRMQPVTVLWRDREQVVISAGLAAGDLVISSHLSAPVDGMAVRYDGMPDFSADATGQATARQMPSQMPSQTLSRTLSLKLSQQLKQQMRAQP